MTTIDAWRPASIRLTRLVFIAGALCLLTSPALRAMSVPSPPHVGASPDSAQLDTLTREELQVEKLRQEVVQLRYENQQLGYENEQQRGFWASLPEYVPFITALVAVAGIFITLWKQINETSRQKVLDRRERKAEREQRDRENRRHTDEQFNAIAKSLGADTEPMRASGAVSIATFAKSGYEEYYDQAFMLVLANLKIDHSPAITSLLINSFEKIARKYIPRHDGELDLSNLTLTGVNLSELDLTGADLGFADLRRANFTGATLQKVRGYKAKCAKARFSRANLQAARLHKAEFTDGHFHNARLIDVKMKEADLTRAQFHQAKLQGAHLEEATLTDAEFQQADLNETFFTGAKGLTPKTLKSIINAKHWEKAHFDDAIRDQLNALAKERDA